ncbi:MAG: tetratricopeptide repeat protein [Deltaproteobacteria bacterium]|nr:tetratricopeptide repeat protein [Deltaproteobacteria bacterium]
MKALSRDPAERYQTALEMLESIRRFSCYAKRQERLTCFAATIGKPSVAGGDLGAPESEPHDSSAAAKVFSALPAASAPPPGVTPAGWSQTGSKTTKRRSPLPVVLAVAGVAVLLAGGGLWLAFGSREQPAPLPVAPATTTSAPIVERAAESKGKAFLSGLPDPSGPTLDDRQAHVHLNKGRKYEADQHHDDAIAEYREALRLNPSLNKTWGEMAYALKNAGRYEEAEAVGLKAVDIGGDAKFMSNVHFNLGWIMQDTGRKQEAIKYYEQAIAEGPANSYVSVKLKEVRGY